MSLLPRPSLLWCALLLAFLPVVVRAEEAWEKEAHSLFDLYAKAMNGSGYADFLSACEAESRDMFRQLTLYDMAHMTEEDLQGVLPRDNDNKPIPLQALIEMTDKQFWTIYTGYMRRREEVAAKIIKEAQEKAGAPRYEFRAMSKVGDTIYIVTERVWATPPSMPAPLSVVEIVREGEKWRMKIPREILLESAEHARERKAEFDEAHGEHSPDDGHDHGSEAPEKAKPAEEASPAPDK